MKDHRLQTHRVRTSSKAPSCWTQTGMNNKLGLLCGGLWGIFELPVPREVGGGSDKDGKIQVGCTSDLTPMWVLQVMFHILCNSAQREGRVCNTPRNRNYRAVEAILFCYRLMVRICQHFNRFHRIWIWPESVVECFSSFVFFQVPPPGSPQKSHTEAYS